MENISGNNKILTITYKKSDIAEKLEERYNLVFDPVQDTPFDNFFYLRACHEEPIVIKKTPIVIDTGLIFQLTHPNTFMQVHSYSNLLREKGIGVLNTHFDFDFRNAIRLLVYNYSEIEQQLFPADIFASISFYYYSSVEIRKANPIVFPSEKAPKVTKDNNWIKEGYRQKLNDKALLANYKEDEKNIKYFDKKSIEDIVRNRLK